MCVFWVLVLIFAVCLSMLLRKLVGNVEEENSRLANMKLSLEECYEQVKTSLLFCDANFFLYWRTLLPKFIFFPSQLSIFMCMCVFLGGLYHLGQVQWPEESERADLQGGWASGFWHAGKVHVVYINTSSDPTTCQQDELCPCHQDELCPCQQDELRPCQSSIEGFVFKAEKHIFKYLKHTMFPV